MAYSRALCAMLILAERWLRYAYVGCTAGKLESKKAPQSSKKSILCFKIILNTLGINTKFKFTLLMETKRISVLLFLYPQGTPLTALTAKHQLSVSSVANGGAYNPFSNQLIFIKA